jgi:uncharacterized protein (DUF849 family)
MLQACLNGGRTKQFSAAVPVTPRELATDAKAVVEAGAQELHVHPRDASGQESLDPDDVAEAIQAIRASVPGIPIGLSTGCWIAPGGDARREKIRAWHVLPDYVSVNLVEEDAPEIIALVMEKGIDVEAGLWGVSDAERFVKLPGARSGLRVLIEINQQDVAEGREVAQAILGVLNRSEVHMPRLLHGSDATKWPIFRDAVRLGLDSRIGFEDGDALPSGSRANSNAELIRAARVLLTK